jgi:hypothetical protein
MGRYPKEETMKKLLSQLLIVLILNLPFLIRPVDWSQITTEGIVAILAYNILGISFILIGGRYFSKYFMEDE